VDGVCVCDPPLLACGGVCVDPATDNAYCGATGTCQGAAAGSVCTSGKSCSGGLCQ
jgi:hypothetical protein